MDYDKKGAPRGGQDRRSKSRVLPRNHDYHNTDAEAVTLGLKLAGVSSRQWTFSSLWKFIATASLIIAASMGALTFLIVESIKKSTLQSVAEESAALMSGVLRPSVQELGASTRLSPETSARLDRLLKEQLSNRVIAVKIWLRDGTIVYATEKKLVGQKFPSPTLESAFAGDVIASFDELNDDENLFDRLLNVPMFEVYAPLYRSDTKDVIAVGEVYRKGDRLASQVRTLQLTSAASIAGATLAMMFLLFLITRRANTIINAHQTALTHQFREARELAAHNERLRLSADEARLEAVQSNERLLAQIGQDLHDGPIQLLSLLMIKLTTQNRSSADLEGAIGVADAGSLTARILREVREISAGLILPQLDGLTTDEVIDLAAREHEYTTGTRVEREVAALPARVASPVAACLFRVLQEGLNNAFQHAGGNNQRLTCSFDGSRIHLTVSDDGAQHASPATGRRGSRAGFGLSGIKRRVEAVGGSFTITAHERGTRLRVTLPIDLVT